MTGDGFEIQMWENSRRLRVVERLVSRIFGLNTGERAFS